MTVHASKHQGHAIDGYVTVFYLDLAESNSLPDGLDGCVIVSLCVQGYRKFIKIGGLCGPLSGILNEKFQLDIVLGLLHLYLFRLEHLFPIRGVA